MKKFICLLLLCAAVCDPAFAEEKLFKNTPRLTDLSESRKKAGADDLAARAKSANSVAELKQIVLELITIETGGK